MLILSVLVIPLWIATAPLYNHALVRGLDISLHIFEPGDMGHRVRLKDGSIQSARWVYGRMPLKFNIKARYITYNGVILIALLLASPIPFRKRWALTLLLSMFALYLFHMLVLIVSVVNPFPFYKPPFPAHMLPYIQRFDPITWTMTFRLTKALHGGAWALAPLVVWVVAARRRVF